MTDPTFGDIVLAQHCLQPDGAWIEVRITRAAQGLAYRLAFQRRNECLLSYEGVATQADTRRLRGRSSPYEFRSVEQLRYDFERDLETL